LTEQKARSALLCGREHTHLGEIGAVAEGPAAITLSRGGAAKRYRYTHPNEDASLFLLGGGGALIAVADGHWGSRGSELVLEHVRGRAESWTAPKAPAESESAWRDEALSLLQELNALLRDDASRRRIDPAPTTLSLALVRRDQAGLLYAGVGDSHLFAVQRDGVRGISEPQRHFLGDRDLALEHVSEIAQVEYGSLAGIRAVVLATDGLTESGIGVDDPCAAVGAAVAEAESVRPSLRALATARALTKIGLEAHGKQRSGDNLACATLWLEGEGSPGSRA